MADHGPNGIHLPEVPDKPVAGYYRCPGPDGFWTFYNGERWVGDPVRLPWYRHPVPFMRGRPPVWAAAGFAIVAAVVAIVGSIPR